MKNLIGSKIEVYSLNELPKAPEDLKYFACIGGNKNYECFLESRSLSRAQFMKKYENEVDICHKPIYEDENLIIRQDAQYPLPGFYIIATKTGKRTIADIDTNLYQKGMEYAFLIKTILQESFKIKKVYIYYDEHYHKPSSVHFWVMPIYEDVLNENNLKATIFSNDIWKYLDLFEFKDTKEEIYKINEEMKKIINKGVNEYER
ncbi:MAG: hypothetical protein IJL74_01715 [Bacilli bacterium]|nr:hypothetical protein [Bacilli bacterium]